MVASTSLSLRQLRARCRFERGEVLEGVSDLAHVLQIAPQSTEPHLQISSMLFYSIGDLDKGIEQMRKCLRSDPDSKACSRLFRREKQLDKIMKQITALREKRQFNSATKLLVGSGEDQGLIQDIKEDIAEAKALGNIHKHSPDELYGSLIEMTCDSYTEVRKLFDMKPETSINEPHADEQQEESSALLHRSPCNLPQLSARPPHTRPTPN